MSVELAVIVPGLPHPLLAHEQNPGWGRLRKAFDEVRDRIHAINPDLLLIYSTMWPSVIGHQIQAHPSPEWVHVDELFHALGSMPYAFRMDAEFGECWAERATRRGLMARTVAYDGFPIDTGSVVALKLLNPHNHIPATIVSSNVYADRAETVVLAKAARDAIDSGSKRVVCVAVMTLSNRLFTDWIAPEDDRIHSLKDDEWNRKVLEFLADGRLEDVAQLSREIHRQIRVHKVVNFKPMWFLSALAGAHNRYTGEVLAYEALHGTGGAVVALTPTASSVGDKEFDEDDVEVWTGDRSVLGAPAPPVGPPQDATPAPPKESVFTKTAAAPVGAYPHARRVGDMLYPFGRGAPASGHGRHPRRADSRSGRQPIGLRRGRAAGSLRGEREGDPGGRGLLPRQGGGRHQLPGGHGPRLRQVQRGVCRVAGSHRADANHVGHSGSPHADRGGTQSDRQGLSV